MSRFQDHFSGHADAYARYRPTYPEGLFEAIADAAPARDLVWDAGCGNGQASLALARHFERVEASDASAQQIAQAVPHPRVRYRVAPAEEPGLEPASVDAVLIAQALHWFDHPRFHHALARVCKAGALVVAVMYDLAQVSPDIDDITLRFYRGAIGPFWPGDRRHIDEQYRSIPWPFAPVALGIPDMVMHWSLDDLMGYFSTWSAVRRYVAAGHDDPLPGLRDELALLWGDADEKRAIRWPLHHRTARMA
jgi:SAM-dependent methyltransferase